MDRMKPFCLWLGLGWDEQKLFEVCSSWVEVEAGTSCVPYASSKGCAGCIFESSEAPSDITSSLVSLKLQSVILR